MYFRARFFASKYFAGRFFGSNEQPSPPVTISDGVYQWWLQQPPRNMRLAIAIGREIELWTEIDPGEAFGVGKTKARRISRSTDLSAGLVLASATAGDASALRIAAIADGKELCVSIEASGGDAKGSASTGPVDLELDLLVGDGFVKGSASTGPVDLELDLLVGDGFVKGSASTGPVDLERTVIITGGTTSAAAISAGVGLEKRSELSTGKITGSAVTVQEAEFLIYAGLTIGRTRGSAIAGGNVININSLQIAGTASGTTGFDPVEIDNDLLLMVAA